MYHQALLILDTMKVFFRMVLKHQIMFADAGNSIGGKTVMEGLPLTGSEYFQLKN